MHPFLQLLFICLLSTSLVAQHEVQISKDQAIDDLNHLITKLEEAHVNPYLHLPSNDFHAHKDSLIAAWSSTDSMRLNLYSIDLMQLLARLNDAHTSLQFWAHFDREASVFFAPVLEHKAGAVFLKTENQSAISTINGQSASRLFDEAMSCYGGLYRFRQQIVEKLFFAVFLHLKGIHAPYEIVLADGQTWQEESTIDLPTLISRFSSQEENYTFEIIDENIGLIRYNSCQDPAAFNSFLTETFKSIKEKEIDKLIVDIRYNTGGNSILNELLLAYVTTKPYRQSAGRTWKVSETLKDLFRAGVYRDIFGKRVEKLFLSKASGTFIHEDEYGLIKPKKKKNFFEGQACMLIGPQTFSSANFLADAVATYNLMPLIGLPTGEYTNDFGEQIEVALPATGLSATMSVAFDIGADGDADKIDVVHPDHHITTDALQYAIDYLKKTN